MVFEHGGSLPRFFVSSTRAQETILLILTSESSIHLYMKPVRVMILLCCVGGLTLAWCDATMAGNAVFSVDGITVFMPADHPGGIDMFDTLSGSVTSVTVRLGQGDAVGGLALAKVGGVYLVTKKALWLWVPGKPRARWLESAPGNVDFDDVACNPKTGEVLVTSGAALYYKRDQRKGLIPVGIRYPPGDRAIRSPVFLKDGSFLFSADGDLWHGYIDYQVESAVGTNEVQMADLVAYRYAPVARRETYNGTPAETGILSLAISRNKVYANFSRMGGTGWGNVIRLDQPVQKAREWVSFNTAKEIARTLGSVEDLGITSGGAVFLCGSSDGHRVYYGDGASQHRSSFCIAGDGAIKPVLGVRASIR